MPVSSASNSVSPPHMRACASDSIASIMSIGMAMVWHTYLNLEKYMAFATMFLPTNVRYA